MLRTSAQRYMQVFSNVCSIITAIIKPASISMHHGRTRHPILSLYAFVIAAITVMSFNMQVKM